MSFDFVVTCIVLALLLVGEFSHATLTRNFVSVAAKVPYFVWLLVFYAAVTLAGLSVASDKAFVWAVALGCFVGARLAWDDRQG